MTPIIYNLIFGWYRSTSGRHRPFPSDFGHLRPFYSLQNRRIFLRFVGERRQARGEHESLLPCATRTSVPSHEETSENWRKWAQTDDIFLKWTSCASGFGKSRLFYDGTVWFLILTFIFRRYTGVSDTCVPSWTVLTGFGHRFSDVLVRFQKVGPFS